MNPREGFVPHGLATGIGSLPHTDPEVAVEKVLEYVTDCPFWPQLPKLGPQEGMTLQYVVGFPGAVEEGGSVKVDVGEKGQAQLPAFYEKIISEDFAPFALDPERAKGFEPFIKALDGGAANDAAYVKGHITGPVTLASSLKDFEGKEITHDPSFVEAVSAILKANACWQVDVLSKYGKKVIIFFDEPVMEVFGSAYSTIDRAGVEALWTPILQALRARGALTGIHCCGNTDWGLLLTCGTDIVNFDAYHFLDKMVLYANEVERFMREGGALAWGVVPTDEKAADETPESLYKRLSEGIDRFVAAGVDRELVRNQTIITPSCGMGSLDVKLTERILMLLKETSRLFKEGG